MLKTIIVDDEDKGRETLHNLLKRFCPEVAVVGLADSAENGFIAIEQHKPELIFLDIEMPKADGFSLIDRAMAYDFEVILTTAFPQYAVQAFRYSVLDYLLKPININNLLAAVAKAQHALETKKHRSSRELLGKLALPTLEGYEMVDINKIIRCEADVNYTIFHFSSRDKIIIARALKEVEEALAPYNFFRVHKHHLINLHYASRYVKGSGGQLQLTDGTVVDVSWRNKNDLLNHLRSLT